MVPRDGWTFLRTPLADNQQGPPAYPGDPDGTQLKSGARYGAEEQIYHPPDGIGVRL
jgi:hypothetical protein